MAGGLGGFGSRAKIFGTLSHTRPRQPLSLQAVRRVGQSRRRVLDGRFGLFASPLRRKVSNLCLIPKVYHSEWPQTPCRDWYSHHMVSGILQADCLQAGTCVHLPTSWHLFVAHKTEARPVSIQYRSTDVKVPVLCVSSCGVWCVAPCGGQARGMWICRRILR